MIRVSKVTSKSWAPVASANYKYSAHMHRPWCETFVARQARETLSYRSRWLFINHVASSCRSLRFLFDKPFNATNGLVCR